MKFIIITIDEIVVVAILVVIVGYFIPELYLIAIITAVVGSVLFVIAKYYIIYPSLDDTSVMYDVDGMIGIVIQPVSAITGKVKIAQEIWDARCEEGEIPAGTKVTILSRDSMVVIVRPLDTG